jgi:hypothetical protein
VPDSLSAQPTIGGIVKQFYTYMWLREDGTPYYIGKGCGERAFIRRGHRANVPPKERVVIYAAASEVDAFETEIALIWYYGRKSMGTGCLINLTDGGTGISGAKIVRSEESKRKQAATMIGMKRSEETKLKTSLAKRKPELSGTFYRWTVVKRGTSVDRRTQYLCRCTCGTVKEVSRDSLLQGTSKSCGCLRRELMIGLGVPKKKPAVPAAPAETPSLNSTPMPSWMTGEAPTPAPRRKNPRIDSGGQLARGSMRAA